MPGDAKVDGETVPVSTLVQHDSYQVMPPLAEAEYTGLKSDIRENGVRTPIVVDDRESDPGPSSGSEAEDGGTGDLRKVIDGHHRVRACRELGIEDVPVRRVDPDLGLDEKRELAWKLNMQRRHFDEGEKRDRIEDYFLDIEAREVHKTDEQIAQLLGVSESWVREIRHDLVETGKIGSGADFTTQQSIREQIAEQLDEEPEASDRSVADDVGTSHPTVRNVRERIEEADAEEDDGRPRPRVFRHRPYLDSRAQEYLNQAARRIARREPEWVDDPSEPSVAECLQELRERPPDAAEHDRPSAGGIDVTSDDSGSDEQGMDPDTRTDQATDTELLLDLLAAGLDYQEVVYWVLYEFDGLGPIEVFHATAGKQKSYSRDLDRHAIRNVERVLASAARKLDAELDLARSEYMYDPADSGGGRSGQ